MFRDEFITHFTSFFNGSTDATSVSCTSSHGEDDGYSDYEISVVKEAKANSNAIVNVVIKQDFYHPYFDCVTPYTFSWNKGESDNGTIECLLQQSLTCIELNKTITIDGLLSEIDVHYTPDQETEAYSL
jgi:hypothetical protein